MYNFKFQNPTKIIFGKGMIAELAKEIPHGKRILITFGGGSVRNNGVYDQVKQALASHYTEEFWGIEPNPKYETLMQAVILGRQKNIDFILAVGGGSVVDGSKFIAAAIPYDGEPWDLVSKHIRVQTTVPLATVITLPATGSEMNCGAVISRKSTMEKLVLSTPLNYPKFSILDPEVTFSLPKGQIAAGLIDTFIHNLQNNTSVTQLLENGGRNRSACNGRTTRLRHYGQLYAYCHHGIERLYSYGSTPRLVYTHDRPRDNGFCRNNSWLYSCDSVSATATCDERRKTRQDIAVWYQSMGNNSR